MRGATLFVVPNLNFAQNLCCVDFVFGWDHSFSISEVSFLTFCRLIREFGIWVMFWFKESFRNSEMAKLVTKIQVSIIRDGLNISIFLVSVLHGIL